MDRVRPCRISVNLYISSGVDHSLHFTDEAEHFTAICTFQEIAVIYVPKTSQCNFILKEESGLA